MLQETQLATSSVICFGKVPTHGDFVRHNASSPSARALDEWLQEALYVAKPHIARGAAGGLAPQYGFIYAPPRSQRPLAGIVQMSRDQVGRAYPFVLAVEWDARHAEPGYLAASVQRLQPVLSWASPFVAQAVSGGLDHREFPRLFSDASPQPSATLLPRTRASLDAATLRPFCEQLWDSFDDGRKYRVFKNLLDVLPPMRGTVPLGYSLSLRFPTVDRSKWSVPAEFWLAACAALLRRTSSTPSLFFTEQSGSSGRPFLMLFPGTAPARSAAALFAPTLESKDIIEMDRAGRGSDAEAALALPPLLGQLLEDGSTSLREVLASL